MKENKGKEVVDEATKPKAQSQLHPSIGDKRKTLPKTLDLRNLPNCRGKKAKHGSSRPGVVFPPLNRLSKFLMLTHPFPSKSLQPRPLRLPRLSLPRGFL